MRQILWILAFALTSSFAARQMDGAVAAPETKSEETDVKALIDKARWGDGDAFLKLADCYRDGKGVKQDFWGMVCMLAQAEEQGKIKDMDDYMRNMPKDNVYRQMLGLFNISRNSVGEYRDSIENVCSIAGVPDAYVIRGMQALEEGDSVRASEMFKIAEEKGCMFGVIIQGIHDLKNNKELDVAKIETVATSYPVAYLFLAKNSLFKGNIRKCKEYLLKAEENAMLNKREAQWLLEYCKGDMSEEDIRRIESFASVDDVCESVEDSVSVDTVAVDTVCVDDEAVVMDTAVVDTAVVSDNGVVQISPDACDSIMVEDVIDRYGVAYKDGKCGVYDISRQENVTNIEFDYLRYTRRIEIEGGYYSYFYWERDADNGTVGIVEEDNHFMIMTAPRKENGE